MSQSKHGLRANVNRAQLWTECLVARFEPFCKVAAAANKQRQQPEANGFLLHQWNMRRLRVRRKCKARARMLIELMPCIAISISE
jgi:hypothetical protein